MPTDLVEIDYGRITVESDDPLVRAEIRACRRCRTPSPPSSAA